MVLSYVIYAAVLLLQSLSLVVVLRHATESYYKGFARASVFLLSWTTATACLSFFEQYRVDFIALVFYISPVYLFYYLAQYFFELLEERRRRLRIANVFIATINTLIIAVAELTRENGFFTFQGENLVPEGVPFLLYAVLLVFPTLLVTYSMSSSRVKNRNRETARLNRSLFFASSIPASLAFLTNLIFPAVGIYEYISFGPVLATSYVFLNAYAAAKHEAFGIRKPALRSTGYFMSLLVVGGLYFALVFTLVSLALSEGVSILIQLLIVAVGLTAGITFRQIRAWFDELTNRLFLRDSYTVEDVVESMSDVVTTRIELENIIGGADDVYRGSVRPEWVAFLIDPQNDADDVANILVKEAEEKKKHSTSKSRKTDKDDLEMPDHIVLGDRLSAPTKTLRLLKATESDFNLPNYGRTPKELQGFMMKKGIAFSQAMKTADRTVGFILFGPKSSGSAYDMQDVKMLNITSGQLAVAIENALRFESIKRFNIKLQGDIETATAELRRTNKKLVELDATKDDFMSIASHQLRTPLTSIKGYLSMFEEGTFGSVNHDQKRALREAVSSSNRMIYLIADLLSVSRLRSGKFKADKHEFNLAAEIREQAKQIKPLANAKKIKFTTHMPVGELMINADRMKIGQVLMNFMDNAVHYTPDKGKIDVYLTKKGSKVEFKVVDNGIGIPKPDQKELFSKFHRAKNARKFRPDGTGIGVFIARKIILLHGGEVIFESVEDEGSTFGFSIPINDKPKKARKSKPARHKKSSK